MSVVRVGALLNPPPPDCPANAYFLGIHHPSITVESAVKTLMCFAFALAIGLRYNGVRIQGQKKPQKITPQNTSNNLWILYFIAVTIAGIAQTGRWALCAQEVCSNFVEDSFFLATEILHGTTALAISLALNHQRRHRASPAQQGEVDVPVPPTNQQFYENEPLLKKYSWLKRTVKGHETILFICFVAFLIALYLFTAHPLSSGLLVLYIVMASVQQLPIVVITIYIVTRTDGPERGAKAMLIVALVCYLTTFMPLEVWSSWLDVTTCALYFASYVDIIHVVGILSNVFFFVFVRSEYIRNKPETIFNAIQKVQDAFDVRRF